MKHEPVSARMARLYLFFVIVLAVTGTLQLPLAGRYRLAAAPGLGWTGDFWLTHKLHYAAAAGLLYVIAYLVTRWMMEWRRDFALTALGCVRAAVLLLLVLTGSVRVLKNLPDVSFAPDPTMLADWAHMALAVLLGLVALLRVVLRASYVQDLREGEHNRRPQRLDLTS